MQEFITTVTSKGRITIPIEVRRYLGTTIGDRLAFVIEEDGTVQIRASRYPDIASLSGAVGSLPKPLFWHDIKQIAYEDRFLGKDTDV